MNLSIEIYRCFVVTITYVRLSCRVLSNYCHSHNYNRSSIALKLIQFGIETTLRPQVEAVTESGIVLEEKQFYDLSVR